MRFRPRLLTMFGLVPTLLIAGVCLLRPAFLHRLELTTYDTVLRSTPLMPPGGRVIIVDVDEKSLTTVGQWPWRRDLVGQLVSQIRDGGAAAIALDIIFAERDRYEGPRVSPDAALAEAFKPGRVFIGYGMTFDQPGSGSGDCIQHPLPLAVLQRGEKAAASPFFEATGVICSLPTLAEAAGNSGFLNAAPDPDGLLRRAPLMMELGGRIYPSLGLAAVTAIQRTRDLTLHITHDNASTLVAANADAAGGEWSVPLDARSNLLLRYRGRKRTFEYVSAVDVLKGHIGPATFRNKLVLVGTTALGTREVVATPHDTLFTGVEVQATIADNLLQRDFISRPSHGVAIETLAVLLLGVISTLFVSRFGLTSGATLAACLMPATWAASVGLLGNGSYVSPLFPTLGLFCVLGSTALAGFTLERRRADREGREKADSKRLMIQTLLSLTEIRDTETGKHSRRTQQFTRVLAQELARNPQYSGYLTPERIDLLSTLAPLHDIGKVGVPDSVLNKPGKLTPEELVEMRKHPVHGRDVIVKAEQATGIKDDATLEMAKDIVYTHHEKWDGTGYPDGVRAEAIPIPGRVMAVVDVYDACTTRSLYTPSLSQDDTVALIVKGRGTHFDPAVVDAFLVVAPVMRGLSEAAQELDDHLH